MKILTSNKYGLEILKKMHKNFTQKFGDICTLSDLITLKNEEDFNKFKKHFGFNGKVERFFSIFRTENQYIEIYILVSNNTHSVYLKGSRISGKDVYVLQLDKIFKSNGAKSFIEYGYRVNQFTKSLNEDAIFQMLNGKFDGVVKGHGSIELDCGLRVKVNESSSSTLITYETL